MRSKKLIAMLGLVMAMMVPASGIAAAAPVQRASIRIDARIVPPSGSASTSFKKAPYAVFTGKVTELTKFMMNDGMTPVEGKWFVLVENKNGDEMTFIVSDDTYRITGAKGRVGSTVTGWYDASLPATMIYPPQREAEIMLVGELPRGQQVKVDAFDAKLVSGDGMLKLTPGPDTQIVREDGTPYAGKLENYRLVVLYRNMTLSLPTRTAPDKIVVLDEAVLALPGNPSSSARLELVVSGKRLSAPVPYMNANGVVMVPLSAVAERLGYPVGYDAAIATMTLGNTASVTVGADRYAIGRRAPITLGTAPELSGREVYIPMTYFTRVLGLNNAYFLEGQIVIDDGEKMM